MVGKIKQYFSSITVEPVVFLTFTALLNQQLVKDTGILYIVCHQYYEPLNENLNCRNLSTSPQLEDQIQQRATLWIMMMAGAVILPAMVSDIILGAWGDLHGRKLSMLLGLAGTIVIFVLQVALFTFQWIPIHVIVVCNLISGVTGSTAIVLISAYAFLADTIKDKNVLTFRMGLLAVCLAAGQTVGSYSAGKLLEVLTFAQAALVPVCLLTLAFFYCLLFVPNIVPEKTPTSKSGENAELIALTSTTKNRRQKSFIFADALELLREVYKTFTKRRTGNKRRFLIVGTLVFFISTFTDFHNSVMTLFAYHRPLYWTPDQLGTWKAVDNSLAVLGNLAGVILSKRLLHLSDTTLVLLGLITCAAHHVMIGLSRVTWMVYLAVVVGMLCNLVPPTISSFITHYVDSDEVGKVFSGFAVAAEIALVTAALGFNAIYSATVTFFPGFVFMCMAGFILLAVGMMIWVHIKAKTETKIAHDGDDDGKEASNNKTSK